MDTTYKVDRREVVIEFFEANMFVGCSTNLKKWRYIRSVKYEIKILKILKVCESCCLTLEDINIENIKSLWIVLLDFGRNR